MNLEADYTLKEIAEQNRAAFSPDFFSYRDFIEESLAKQQWPELQSRGEEPNFDKRLIKAILEELRLLFCTNDARYKDVRNKAGAFSKVALPAVAAYIAGACGVSVAIASGGVAFIGLAVFKVSIGVFCRLSAPPVNKPTA